MFNLLATWMVEREYARDLRRWLLDDVRGWQAGALSDPLRNDARAVVRIITGTAFYHLGKGVGLRIEERPRRGGYETSAYLTLAGQPEREVDGPLGRTVARIVRRLRREQETRQRMAKLDELALHMDARSLCLSSDIVRIPEPRKEPPATGPLLSSSLMRRPLNHFWKGKKIVSYEPAPRYYRLEDGSVVDASVVDREWSSPYRGAGGLTLAAG